MSISHKFDDFIISKTDICIILKVASLKLLTCEIHACFFSLFGISANDIYSHLNSRARRWPKLCLFCTGLQKDELPITDLPVLPLLNFMFPLPSHQVFVRNSPSQQQSAAQPQLKFTYLLDSFAGTLMVWYRAASSSRPVTRNFGIINIANCLLMEITGGALPAQSLLFWYSSTGVINLQWLHRKQKLRIKTLLAKGAI